MFCNTTDLPEPKPDTVPLTVYVAGVLLDELEELEATLLLELLATVLDVLDALDVLEATLLLALLATELDALEAALLLELLTTELDELLELLFVEQVTFTTTLVVPTVPVAGLDNVQVCPVGCAPIVTV